MKKKNIMMIAGVLACIANIASAQDADSSKRQPNFMLYSVLINLIPDGQNIPAIGFINYGAGSHNTAQVGFINHINRKLAGVQVGFLNSVGKDLKGGQAGFVNIAAYTTQGSVQAGFVNITAGTMLGGAQVGFVNIPKAAQDGFQVGFANIVGGSESRAAQVGFVNVVAQTPIQVGFVNAAKRVSGVQIGFVNTADTLEGNALALGFVSVVKRGGYNASEVSISDMAAVMFWGKTGMERFYTTFGIGYNPRFRDGVVWGWGMGFIANMSSRFYFNPELTFSNAWKDGTRYLNLTPSFGYKIGRWVSVVAGPSVCWQHSVGSAHGDGNSINKPFFGYSHDINSRHRIVVGAKAGLRFVKN